MNRDEDAVTLEWKFSLSDSSLRDTRESLVHVSCQEWGYEAHVIPRCVLLSSKHDGVLSQNHFTLSEQGRNQSRTIDSPARESIGGKQQNNRDPQPIYTFTQ